MTSTFRKITTVSAIAIGAAGMGLVLKAWNIPPFDSGIETTDNAYVRGQVTVMSPQLAGYIAEVPVRDYQKVHAGDVLVRIDDRIYQQKLLQARATLASQKASLAALEQSRKSAEARVAAAEAQIASTQAALHTAEANSERATSLQQRGFAAQSALDQSRSVLEQARAAAAQAQATAVVARQDVVSVDVSRQSILASIGGAEAAVRLAEIDVDNTRITAPVDGTLGEVGARVGQYVSAGTQLTFVVPDRIWVSANFKETQLRGMRLGQSATFTVDALGGERLKGTIESFSPAAGSEFSVLKADNATGNFTKVAQRLPVRIAISPDQPGASRLSPGMSVVVSVARETRPVATAALKP